MSSLLPSRLSRACTSTLIRLCTCSVGATHFVRCASTTTKRTNPTQHLGTPTALGSPASQVDFSVKTEQDIVNLLNNAKTPDDCVEILRNATKSKVFLTTPAAIRTVVRNLCKDDNIEEARKILMMTKTNDLLSCMIVIYACTLAKKRKEIKTLIDYTSKIPGSTKLSLKVLHRYAKMRPRTPWTSKDAAEAGNAAEELTKNEAESEEEGDEAELSKTEDGKLDEIEEGEGEKGQQGEEGERKEPKHKMTMEARIYNIMLEGYILLGDLEAAKEVLHVMESKQFIQDSHYEILVQSLASSGNIQVTSELLAHMKAQNKPLTTPKAIGSVITLLGSKKQVDEAVRMYEDARDRGILSEELTSRILTVLTQNQRDATKILQRDAITTGANAYIPSLISMYTKSEFERGINLLRELETNHVPLTNNFVVMAMKLLSRAGHQKAALELVQKLEKQGVKPDEQVNTMTLDTMTHHGMVPAMYKKLAELRKNGELTIGLYNSVLDGLVHRGNVDEAWRLLDQMRADGIPPDAKSFVMLAECSEIGLLQRAEEAVNKARELGIDPTLDMYVSVAKGACAAGNFVYAWKVMDILESAPKITNEILLRAYNNVLFSMVQLNKPVQECEDVCRRMLLRKLFPDAYTYESLIVAHVNNGSLGTAFGLFEKLKDLKITPTTKTKGKLHAACNKSSNMEWYNKHVGTGY